MKVYLVRQHIRWESDHVIGVYKEEDDALEVAEEHNKLYINKEDHYFSYEGVEVK